MNVGLQLFQKRSQNVRRRLQCGSTVFVAHQLYFLRHHGQAAWRADSYPDPRSPNVGDHDLDVLANQDSLTLTPRHD